MSQPPRVIADVRTVVKQFARRSRLPFFQDKNAGAGLVAVNAVSMTISEGEVVGLVGESGSGKTTLGKCILRLHDIDGGQVLLDGQDIHQLKGDLLRQARVRYQMIFQNPYSSLNPGMRVEDMLSETLSIHLGIRGSQADGVIDEMLRVVSLSTKRRSFPGQLSGGEKRRVGLARVLLLKPRLVVADEPTAGLDASLKAGVLRLMLEARAPEMAYLFISHDLNLVRSVGDRILVMFRGNLVEVVPRGAFELGLVHHPYTDLLLSSFYLGGGRKVLIPPPPPSPVENFSLPVAGGCCYYPYCNRARSLGSKAEICQRVTPPLSGNTAQGQVACHFT